MRYNIYQVDRQGMNGIKGGDEYGMNMLYEICRELLKIPE